MMFNFNSMYSIWIIGLVILIAVAILVANDASKRGHNSALWAFVVVIMPMMGIIFYLIFISMYPSLDNIPNKRNPIRRTQTTPQYSQPQQYAPPFHPQANESSENQHKSVVNSKFCVSCGKGNIDTAQFCITCGTEIPNLNQN